MGMVRVRWHSRFLLPCVGLVTAMLAGTAQAEVFLGVGKLGACQTVAVCPDALTETCTPVSELQRIFSAPVNAGDGAKGNRHWAEAAYSRFPKSDVNETTGFLPVNPLIGDDWRDRISALAEGREVITGPADALWGRFQTDAGQITLAFYQFNPRGLTRRWIVHCQFGDI
jgi:hypothetical protein